MLKQDLWNCELDRRLPKGKNKNNNWFNKRGIRWKNNESNNSALIHKKEG